MKDYKTIIGIDTGLTGAIVRFNKSLVYTGHHRMPVIEKPGKATVSSKVSGGELFVTLLALVDEVSVNEVCIFIEDPGIIPTNGVFRVASQHHTLGVVEGVIGSLGYDYFLVPAKKWKSQYDLPGGRQHKQKAIEFALHLNPELGPLKIKDADIAEAALVARYGAKYIIGYNPPEEK